MKERRSTPPRPSDGRGFRAEGKDRLSRERRSWNMSRIRGKNTTPELRVRSLLHRLGYRFRLHVRFLATAHDAFSGIGHVDKVPPGRGRSDANLLAPEGLGYDRRDHRSGRAAWPRWPVQCCLQRPSSLGFIAF